MKCFIQPEMKLRACGKSNKSVKRSQEAPGNMAHILLKCLTVICDSTCLKSNSAPIRVDLVCSPVILSLTFIMYVHLNMRDVTQISDFLVFECTNRDVRLWVYRTISVFSFLCFQVLRIAHLTLLLNYFAIIFTENIWKYIKKMNIEITCIVVCTLIPAHSRTIFFFIFCYYILFLFRFQLLISMQIHISI